MKLFTIKLKKWSECCSNYGDIGFYRKDHCGINNNNDVIIWYQYDCGWFIEQPFIACLPEFTNTPELLMFQIDLVLLDNHTDDVGVEYILDEPFIFPENDL